MFSLELARCGYLRVRKGVTAGDIEAAFCCPVGEVCVGLIIKIPLKPLKIIRAEVGDDYKKIAAKHRIDEEELKKLNGNKPVYPTKKIYLPNLS